LTTGSPVSLSSFSSSLGGTTARTLPPSLRFVRQAEVPAFWQGSGVRFLRARSFFLSRRRYRNPFFFFFPPFGLFSGAFYSVPYPSSARQNEVGMTLFSFGGFCDGSADFISLCLRLPGAWFLDPPNLPIMFHPSPHSSFRAKRIDNGLFPFSLILQCVSGRLAGGEHPSFYHSPLPRVVQAKIIASFFLFFLFFSLPSPA